MTDDVALQPTPTARTFFGVNALLAWVGPLIAFLVTLFGLYPNTNTNPTLFGFNPDGLAGIIGRISDYCSYFTHLSNIVVAIVLTMIWRGSPRIQSKVFAVLRLDSLIMITVTGLIFALVLAPTMQLRGWENASNALEHYITPLLTIIVFIVFGPRRMFSYRLVLPALILPLTWVVLVMIRGAIIDAYPYGFVNAAEWGYGTVMMNIVGVVIVGVLFSTIFVAIDRFASKRQRAN